MFTAEEYRTAAKVLAEEPDPAEGGLITVQCLKKRAEKAEVREAYATQLGKVIEGLQLPGYYGVRIMKKLFADGWTAPEGLF